MKVIFEQIVWRIIRTTNG